MTPPTILTSSYEDIKYYYNAVLNKDTTTQQTTNDISTPIECIEEMLRKIPEELWSRPNLSILDPCCGNGNFHVPIYHTLRLHLHSPQTIVESILHFNDVNLARLKHVAQVFAADTYTLQCTAHDFLTWNPTSASTKHDLIVANPPYALFTTNGKRASKNHNPIKAFLTHALQWVKPDGYILFITPDNWMSLADRNTLITTLTQLQFIHLDIHSAKKYFKTVGSSFTWYIIQNRPATHSYTVSGIWKKTPYEHTMVPMKRSYIPLIYTPVVQSILSKTLDHTSWPRFHIETTSDLHRYTKASLLQNEPSSTFPYKQIHTPTQTVWASRPHKYQNGIKVFLSLTNRYKVFIDDCGMTQSIAFIRCPDFLTAEKTKTLLEHPLYVCLNNLCRWGNFNSVRILQRFPTPYPDHLPTLNLNDPHALYRYYSITDDEITFIQTMQ